MLVLLHNDVVIRLSKLKTYKLLHELSTRNVKRLWFDGEGQEKISGCDGTVRVVIILHASR